MARGRRVRHVASPRLVPHANRLGLAWPSQAETALVGNLLLQLETAPWSLNNKRWLIRFNFHPEILLGFGIRYNASQKWA
jgi:hypothetical protein